jgi:hypothetical protein
VKVLDFKIDEDETDNYTTQAYVADIVLFSFHENLWDDEWR